MTNSRYWSLLALAACAVLPAVGHAQSRALSLWFGAGRTVRPDSVAFTLRTVDLHGAVQLDLPILPVALRGDVTLTGGDGRNGRRNVIASAILPLRLPIVQPYAMLGYGIYDWRRGGERRGLSYGAGGRLQLGGMGVFGQLRRHAPLDRSVVTVGVVF